MVIKLQNLSKYYYTSTNVTKALEKVSFEMRSGEFVAITGESGSGKSTLLNVISGFMPYDNGELYIDGEDSTLFTHEKWEEFRRDNIGFVFQNYNLMEQYTVLDNVVGAMILKGFTKKEAIGKAKKILEKVGLSSMLKQKAIKLSSGQKQRLSIARALAKDTDIIVADEPTGNLDSETGSQIMELFSVIAKDKLVIMVTHNYEQAKDYVTRQIRLYDGQVVLDEQVRQAAQVEEKTEQSIHKIKNSKVAAYFAIHNFKRQPLRKLFFAVFIFITSVLAFLFMGEIYSNYDDTHTRYYEDNVFYNGDDTRLVVKREDGKMLNDEDVAVLKNIPHVQTVDKYDVVNDIVYACFPGKDYIEAKRTYYDYSGDNGKEPYGVSYACTIREHDKFMRSQFCITENELCEGVLPEERYQVAVSSTMGYKPGDTIVIVFSNKNAWGDMVLRYEMTVSGLLTEDTTQVYFEESFCDMMSHTICSKKANLRDSWCNIYKMYYVNDEFFALIDEKLEDETVKISLNYSPGEHYEGLSHMVCEAFGDEAVLAYEKNGEEKVSDIILEMDNNNSITNVLYVSEELFDEMYDKGSDQASVYMEKYAYTDRVIEKLEKAGYEAISCIRSSSMKYDDERVHNRDMVLIISIVVVLLLGVIEVVIVSSILQIKRKDYEILRSMGAHLKVNKRITFTELATVTIVSMALTVILTNVLKNKISMLDEIMAYMEWWKYILYAVYICLLTFITNLVFNRRIEKKMTLK